MRHRALLVLLVSLPLQVAAENWPGWRGPRGDGTSLENDIALRWDAVKGEGIEWKVELPGEGHASPIVWDDRIFLVAALADRQERVLLCLDRRSGGRLWQSEVLKAPLETKHALNSFATSTPATDGELIFVAFLEVDGGLIPARNASNKRPMTPGRMFVAAYDFEGREKWHRRPGDFVSIHGFCSNPLIYKDLVIVNGDHDGDGYIVALNRKDGADRWKIPRPNNTRSYVTPLIRDADGRTQMVVSGSKAVASYDPNTGRQHWMIDGPTEQFVASMVYDGKLFFLTAGFPEKHILAIRPDGRGNVTDTHIAWRETRGAGYVPSPIIAGDYFLLVSDRGIGSCFDSASGERFWMERIGDGHSASAVSAGGLVYFVSDEGVTTVVRPGRTFEVVAKNPLGERVSTSPAISHGRIYLRGHKHLYAIGGPGGPGGPGKRPGRPGPQ